MTVAPETAGAHAADGAGTIGHLGKKGKETIGILASRPGLG
jgi:hypothetical protein